MKKLFGLLIAAIFTLSIVSCGGGSKPSSVVKTYFSSLQAGKYDKVADCINLDASQKEAFIQKMQESYTSESGEAKDTGDYEIISEEISEDGNSATVKVKTTINFNGTEREQELDMELVLVDGKWLIDLM